MSFFICFRVAPVKEKHQSVTAQPCSLFVSLTVYHATFDSAVIISIMAKSRGVTQQEEESNPKQRLIAFTTPTKQAQLSNAEDCEKDNH